MVESLPEDRIDAIPVREHLVSDAMKVPPDCQFKMHVHQTQWDMFERCYGKAWAERNCILHKPLAHPVKDNG